MSKYKLKEFQNVTKQERSEIYQYAIKRSNEIVAEAIKKGRAEEKAVL